MDIQENVKQMIIANYSITQFPQSQSIIDVDLFRDRKNQEKEVPTVPEESMD